MPDRGIVQGSVALIIVCLILFVFALCIYDIVFYS